MKKPNLQAVLPLLLRYLAILIVLLFTVGPFLWLLSTSLKSADENIFAYPPVFIPQSPTLDNFFRVIDSQPFFTYLKNSALVAVLSVALNLLLASLAAYPLARIPFKGRSV
ncbi:MAG: hypothetical protein ACOVN2_02305, partial [Usitatibacteraceae bacterium]